MSISIVPSRMLLALQLVAHLAAAASVLASSIPGWVAALLLIAVGYSLARLRNACLPARLVLHGDGRIETVAADGAANDAEVLADTLVTAPLIVLIYRQQGRVRSLVLAADSMADEDGRQLRLWLRWRTRGMRPA